MDKSSQILVFDRATVLRRRARVAANFAAHSLIFEETATHLLERIQDVKRDFASVLNLSRKEDALAGQLGANVTTSDFTEDEILEFGANSFDLIVSNLTLHWINDLPGALIQIRNVLKPDGLFLAALPGGQTLYELRTSLIEAELAVMGGISPRLSPTLELPTASALLQRANFDLPVADYENITLLYPDMFALMRDLRGMGEANAHIGRLRSMTRGEVFFEAEKIYHEKFVKGGEKLPATFEITFLHGWKPALWRNEV